MYFDADVDSTSVMAIRVVISGGSATCNYATNGGFAYISRHLVQLLYSNLTISNNTALSKGGAIYSMGSRIHCGNLELPKGPLLHSISYNNAKDNGGGLYLVDSRIFMGVYTFVRLDHNEQDQVEQFLSLTASVVQIYLTNVSLKLPTLTNTWSS